MDENLNFESLLGRYLLFILLIASIMTPFNTFNEKLQNSDPL